jgi:hypothetical protein
MTSLCDICNKTYASSSSLWNHKKRMHIKSKEKCNPDITSNVPLKVDIIKSEYKCKYCSALFNKRQHRYRHQNQSCKMKDISGSEINDLRNTVNKLQQEINELKESQNCNKTKKLVMNNSGQLNVNCGAVNNNNINIIPLGKENLDELFTDEQIAEILKLNTSESINKSIFFVCTADNLKQCRNTYISSLEGNNCKVYDESQNKFITKPKEDVLNDVLYTHASSVKTLVDTRGKKKKQERANDFFNKLDTDKKLQKRKKNEINAIMHDHKDNIKPIVDSVNKKQIVQQ